MRYQNTRVLLTGAGGFIGSHVTEALVKAGATVRAMLHYNSRSDEGNLRYLESRIRQEIDVVFGDLNDADSVRKAVRGTTRVFHLGALIAIPYSYLHPLSFIQTNVNGTANVLNACLENGIERVVVTSTSEVYGTAISTPMNENHRLHPQSPYAASKAAADHLAESYFHSYGLPVVVLRPFNTFGPRQSTRAVIPTIMVQALRYGFVEIGATWPTRDFNFVTDVADAFVRAGVAEGVTGEVFNVGTGEEHRIAEVVDIVSDVLGLPLAIHQVSERMRPEGSEVGRLVADAAKAEACLGWRPQHTFRSALETTLAWYGTHEKIIARAHAV